MTGLYDDRDFARFVNDYGHIAVDIVIRKPGHRHDPVSSHETGFSHTPEVVAKALRSLADAIERAGTRRCAANVARRRSRAAS